MTKLELKSVSKTFHSLGREPVKALDGVYLKVEEGTVTGLVGESGSGKSTLIRCIMGLERADSGWIYYEGERVDTRRDRARRNLHRSIQVVFQDPASSLNPRMTVEQLVGEGLIVHKLATSRRARRQRVVELLELVGLDERDLGRYPRSFSGGQRQRIAIARALSVEPSLLVCDEPVSALDVSVQAQVLNLLLDMREQLGLTILFVAHDLAVVKQVCSAVAVISGGHIVEEGPAEKVLGDPVHDYTKSLLAAAPILDPTAARIRMQQRMSENGDV